MPTYAGLDLCPIAPNLVATWTSSVTRPVEAFATEHATVVTATTTATGRETRTLEWGTVTRADLVALEAFLAARKGQLVACWMPDPQWQLPVTGSSAFGITVAPGAAGQLLADRILADPAWRYWIGRQVGSSDYAIRQTASVVTDNGDGTWDWPASVGAGSLGPFVSTNVRYSRLYRCRLASDAYRVLYRTGNIATVTADVVEVTA